LPYEACFHDLHKSRVHAALRAVAVGKIALLHSHAAKIVPRHSAHLAQLLHEEIRKRLRLRLRRRLRLRLMRWRLMRLRLIELRLMPSRLMRLRLRLRMSWGLRLRMRLWLRRRLGRRGVPKMA
jgi:hypothetical protein